jgi:hypothetical protein
METTKKTIKLPRGGMLEVDVTPQFLQIVCDHFGLKEKSDVEDDHLRMYIWGAFKNAVDKAEKS